MSKAYEIGDIVRLVSGGPRMVVEKMHDHILQCVWFDNDGTQWRGPNRCTIAAKLVEEDKTDERAV